MLQRILVSVAWSAMLFCFSSAAAAQTHQTFTLASCTPLPQPTQMHGCAVVGDRIYVFGGNTAAGYTNRVFSAGINPDGSLQTWKEEQPLPDLRHYLSNCVEVINNRIYVVSGARADRPDTLERDVQLQQTALWTEVLPDGTLAPWRISEPFPGWPLANLATCATEEHLFIMGGHGKGMTSDSVLVADISGDGAPRNWRRVATLPTTLWFQGAAILEDRMYVWGGLMTSKVHSVNSRVYSAEVRRDASLGAFREETPMPEAVYSSAFCGFNDYLICVGGRLNGGVPSSKIWFARLESGHVGEWRQLATNLASQVYVALGLDRSRGRIYTTGGQYRAPGILRGGTLMPAVQAFQLGDEGKKPPPLAVPSTVATASSIKSTLSSGKPVLLYFRSSEIPAVQRFEQSVASTPEFKKLVEPYNIQTVDSRRDNALCYEYSVFRVPSMLLLTPDGGIWKSNALRTLGDVQLFLHGR